MNADDAIAIVGVLLIFIAGFFAGMGVCSYASENYYQKQAIENGCAGYDRATGKFQWHQEKMK